MGQGIAQVGTMLMKDDLETLRQERLAKIQSDRDVKLFGQKKELTDIEQVDRKEMSDIEHDQAKDIQGDKNIESELDRSADQSEGKLDRESAERIAGIRALAVKDAASAKGGTATTAWKKYQELKSEFTRLNPNKQMAPEVETALLNAAYGTDERINTKNNEVIFTGLLGEGQQGVTAEYGRPKDESGQPTGSRRDREFRNVPPPAAEPQASNAGTPDPAKFSQVKGDYSKYADGMYNNGKVQVVNGVAYKLK